MMKAFVAFLLLVLGISLMVGQSAQAIPAAHILRVQTASASTPAKLNWSLDTMGAPAAWAAGATGKGVSILVIDTGLDWTIRTHHIGPASILPSFTANPLHRTERVDCGIGGGDPNIDPYCDRTRLIPNPSPYWDGVGHGSFVVCELVCTGTIEGIAPGARVAMAKVFGNGDGADDGDIAAAIRWGAIHHFPIISMSLGSSAASPVMARAVKFAQSLGVTVVAAAGNEADSIFYSGGLDAPASLPGVVSVGAVNSKRQWAYYSNWGKGLSISAPGSGVYGYAPTHSLLYEVSNCHVLCVWNGTSMATPYVAGALADLISAGDTPAQARIALLAGATPVKNHLKLGAGIVNLPGALAYSARHHWLKIAYGTK